MKEDIIMILKKYYTHLSDSKSLVLLILFFGISLFAQLPSIVLVSNPPEGLTSIGGSPFLSSVDTNVYLSAIRLGYLGELLFTNLYTTADFGKGFILPIYIFLGHISRVTNAEPKAIFIISQFIASFVLILSIWSLGSLVFKKLKDQIIYFVITLFVTGFSWIITPFIKIPAIYSLTIFFVGEKVSNLPMYSIDFLTTEATILPLLGTAPHITLTAAFLVFAIIFSIKYISKPTFYNFILYATPTISILFLSTYSILVILLFNSILVLINKNLLGKYKMLLVLNFILLAQSFFVMHSLNSNRSFQEWIKSSEVYSPPVLAFIIGWLGLLLPAYFGIKHIVKNTPVINIGIFLIVTTVLALLPTSISRRYVLTVPIFFAIFAVIGIKKIIIKYPKLKIFLLAFLILASLDNLITYKNALNAKFQLKNNPQISYFYITNDEKEALEWIRQNVPYDEAILNTFRLGNIIPASTGRKVYFGHWSLSGNIKDKEIRHHEFLISENISKTHRFMKENDLTWVVIDNEWIINKLKFESLHPYLSERFTNNSLSIYRIK